MIDPNGKQEPTLAADALTPEEMANELENLRDYSRVPFTPTDLAELEKRVLAAMKDSMGLPPGRYEVRGELTGRLREDWRAQLEAEQKTGKYRPIFEPHNPKAPFPESWDMARLLSFGGIPIRYQDTIPIEEGPRSFREKFELDPAGTWHALVARVSLGHAFRDCELRIEARDYTMFREKPELALVVGLRVPERKSPPEAWQLKSHGIQAEFPVKPEDSKHWHSERMAVRWIRDKVASLLVHELDEVLTLDGDRIFDPHAPGKKIPGAL